MLWFRALLTWRATRFGVIGVHQVALGIIAASVACAHRSSQRKQESKERSFGVFSDEQPSLLRSFHRYHAMMGVRMPKAVQLVELGAVHVAIRIRRPDAHISNGERQSWGTDF